MSRITLEAATSRDAEAIARLHVAVWRLTYRDLAPADAFRILDETHRLARWRAILSAPGLHQAVLLAKQGDRLVGIGSAGAPSELGFDADGEIKSLYVDPAAQGRGLGRRLMASLAQHLARCRYRGVALGVVAGNEPAIAFYRALGGEIAGHYRDPGPVWRSDNILFRWRELSRLVDAAAEPPDDRPRDR
jgi:ribosomal protein S18 acetylase RimI-like enzyme